jgi:glycosyltransferase involved in cell wall biosynthesis
MAAARPVVATRVGGTPEVLTEDCGRLVPARNPTAIANQLQALALDSHLRRRIGAAARARVLETFSLDRMVREYREVYERIAGPGSR